MGLCEDLEKFPSNWKTEHGHSMCRLSGSREKGQVVRRFVCQPKVSFYPKDREASEWQSSIRCVLRLYCGGLTGRGHGLVAKAGFQWQIIRTWIRTARTEA